MQSKEILQAYINTLTDRECKTIYLMLKDLENSKGKYEYYDEDANKSKDGIIKLTPKQYHNILNRWGIDKTKECFKLLAKYLASGKKVKAAHYTLLNGWIETQYNQTHKQRGRQPKHIAIKFEDVKSKAQARVYVAQVPPELRTVDAYVEYLVNRYGVEIL